MKAVQHPCSRGQIACPVAGERGAPITVEHRLLKSLLAVPCVQGYSLPLIIFPRPKNITSFHGYIGLLRVATFRQRSNLLGGPHAESIASWKRDIFVRHRETEGFVLLQSNFKERCSSKSHQKLRGDLSTSVAKMHFI